MDVKETGIRQLYQYTEKTDESRKVNKKQRKQIEIWIERERDIRIPSLKKKKNREREKETERCHGSYVVFFGLTARFTERTVL